MSKTLAILGGSGVGMIAADIAITDEIYGYENIVFLNDSVPSGLYIGKYKRFPVVGSSRDTKRLLSDKNIDFFVAFFVLGKERDTLRKILSLALPPDRQPTLVHPSAALNLEFCRVGHGCLIGPNAIIGPDVCLENNSIVLGGGFIGHNSSLKFRAHVATNAVVGANVQIGAGAHIGSNSTIRERINIGDCALVGAGSTVINDVSPDETVVGTPARPLRRVTAS